MDSNTSERKMREQLYSGFILSSVNEAINDEELYVSKSDLLRQLSTFEVEYDFIVPKEVDSIVAVYDNIISRGLPTFPSLRVETRLSHVFDIAEMSVEGIGAYKFNKNDRLTELIDKVKRAFFLIDPRINVDDIQTSNTYSNNPEALSHYEMKFLYEILPNHFGIFLPQIVETQREISTIKAFNTYKEEKQSQEKTNFEKQRLDFSIELPKANGFYSSIAIETDGKHHLEENQRQLDKRRDSYLKKLGWADTIRLKDLNSLQSNVESLDNLGEFFLHPYILETERNFDHSLLEDENGLDALQIALTPFAVARIQKALLLAIRGGKIRLEADQWNVAVLERDVPCANLAIEDFEEFLNNLLSLEGIGRRMPKINLEVFRTQDFSPCKLNQGTPFYGLEEISESSQYDLIIDISILQRFGFSHPNLKIDKSSGTLITIRSSHSIKGQRKISCAKPIHYKIDVEKEESLKYFLNNIFRKVDFKGKQGEILERSLGLKSVIALLPTGAGKSLTYQISTILQPGITLVVDPLKSLMLDQVNSLKKLGFDSAAFINSSLNAKEKRNRTDALANGCYQFVFISPERLQIPEFTAILQKMTEDTCFTYCVVDEAHCVSEWGHDFRPAYLRLGENARKYCKTYESKTEIPLIGLTGTASYDVLADIQRELFLDDSSHSVITPEKFERKELIFEVVQVPPMAIENDKNEYAIWRAVAQSKYDQLIKILSGLQDQKWDRPRKFDSPEEFFSNQGSSSNAGIVFCPHVGGKFGVHEVLGNIKQRLRGFTGISDVYAGSSDKDDHDENNQEIQKKFIDNDLILLVATKAFGMGIDKPNIRYTIHFSMPQSIESFYQEAGRAGRDENRSYCYLLYSSNPVKSIENEEVSIDKSLMLSFHRNSFPGIRKEKTILWELLNNIETVKGFAWKNRELQIPNLDIAVRVSYWESRNTKVQRLYVNDEDGRSFGYIDLSSGSHKIQSDEKKKTKLQYDPMVVIDSVKNILIENNKGSKNLLRLFAEEKLPGLERRLEEMATGEDQEIVIPFVNSVPSKIVEYLGYSIKEFDVNDANWYCFTEDDFVERIQNRRSQRLSEEQKTKLKRFFYQIRGEQETFRAIYRLSVIGVIDDYKVDYNSKSILATARKKEDSEYLENVVAYIKRYVAPERAKRVQAEILQTKGNSVIQKCCAYLTSFVYETIEKKRKEAIDVMENAIRSPNFTEHVNHYFDSKYTPVFREHSKKIQIDWIWEFLETDLSSQDSLKHIRGACDRVLVEDPENSSLRFLRSFVNFADVQYNKEQAHRDLRVGWEYHKKNYNLKERDFMQVLSKFYKQLVKYDAGIGCHIEPYFLEYHQKWLTSFLNN